MLVYAKKKALTETVKIITLFSLNLPKPSPRSSLMLTRVQHKLYPAFSIYLDLFSNNT